MDELSGLSALIKQHRRRPVFEPGPETTRALLGRAAIERMLPHRDPFLLLDASDAPARLRLLKVHHALFQGGVRPGDRLTLLARAIEQSDYVSTCVGQALRGEEVQALAVFEVYLMD